MGNLFQLCWDNVRKKLTAVVEKRKETSVFEGDAFFIIIIIIYTSQLLKKQLG